MSSLEAGEAFGPQKVKELLDPDLEAVTLKLPQ